MKSFTIYEEYYELITLLSEEEQAYLLLAITRYMFEDIEPDLNDRQNKIFKNLIRPLNASKNKSKNGSIKKSNENQKEIKAKSNENQNEIKEESHQDVNVNVNVNNSLCNINNNLFSIIEENFGRTLAPMEVEELQSWEDNELTRYVIKNTIANGKRSVRYITRVLENYKAKGIKTVIEAEEDTRRFKERNSYKTYQPQEPEWLDKKIDSTKATKQEEEEMNSLLAEFKERG